MSYETKPTLIVYPGLGYDPEKNKNSAERYAMMLPRKQFTIIVHAPRWKNPNESAAEKIERVRGEILQVSTPPSAEINTNYCNFIKRSY